ncbi:MAG: ribosome recycling factor [Bacteroidales bacterium]|nr:ribosome recycling factor [Bacteroidales bacterium]
MIEEVRICYDTTKEEMDKVIKFLENELLKIRAGKASPNMLDGIYIDYYGTKTPLNQIANIATPDPRTIIVHPWDKSVLETIEKAILQANIGLTPQNNGEIIRIPIPPLSEERRLQLVKQVKNEAEKAKVSIRNIRRDANESLKKLKKNGISEDEIKNGEEKIQKLTDQYIEKIDKILSIKEKELLTL